MLKDFEVHLDINAERKELITTSAVFYSRDINTSKILIHITRKNKEILLSSESKVYVLMLFDEVGEIKKHLYNASFEEKNIYSIILPEKVLGYEGVVTAGVYIDYQNDQSADVGYFSFHMKRSMLDSDFPELDTIYVSDFEKALKEIKEKSSEFDGEAQRLIEKILAIENKIDSNQVVKKDEYDINVKRIENDIKGNKQKIDELAITHINDNEKLKEDVMITTKPSEKPVKYIAHRGNHSQYPENSIGAFASVRNHWGIESDIQVTKDGHWVIMHDVTVDRTTNGTGRVDELTLEQIKNLTLNFPSTWLKDKIPNDYDKIPTFEQYLNICKEKSKIPVIEIKKGNYTSENFNILAKLVSDNLQIDKIVFISFDYNVLLEIRKRLPKAFVLFLADSINQQRIDEIHSDFKYRCGVNIKWSDVTITQENISYTHSKGMLFGVWTVPDNQFANMSNLGVDFITTDSQSTELRTGVVKLENNFEEDDKSYFVNRNSVIQNENGTVTLKLLVINGTNDKGAVIGRVPEWAIPLNNVWGYCSVRTSNGSSFATADIHGRLSPSQKNESQPGCITVGLNWSARTTWANIEITYDLY